MDTRAASGLVSGIVLAVIGAIMYYAVSADVEGVNINTVGMILMVAGVILAALGLLSALTAGMREDRRTVRHVERDVEVPPERTIIERERR